MSLSIPTESYLNASEHQFNLSFSEVLLLRDYCRTNGTFFCSSMGGCESIRDLQESKYLGADAVEFPFIESLFSFSKIFTALEKVFSDEKNIFLDYKVFINIGSFKGIDFLLNLEDFKLPEFIKRRNIIFTFDRIKLARDKFKIKTSKVNLINYESEINKNISEAISKLNYLQFSNCISGGINVKSLKGLYEMPFNKTQFIKTGLFTIKINQLTFDKLVKCVQISQGTEAKLLNLMNDTLNKKIDYLNERILSINDDIYESL